MSEEVNAALTKLGIELAKDAVSEFLGKRAEAASDREKLDAIMELERRRVVRPTAEVLDEAIGRARGREAGETEEEGET